MPDRNIFEADGRLTPDLSRMDVLKHDRNVTDALIRHARERPDQPFLILETDRGRHVTSFAVLLGKARRYAAYFVSKNIRPGQHVACLFTLHAEQAPVFFGLIMAGAVPFLLPTMTVKQDPVLFWQAQLAVLTRTDAQLIVTDCETKNLLAVHAPSFGGRIVDVETIALETVTADPPVPPAQRGQTAFLQHSSGTTGAKKGVVLSHAMVLDFVAALGTALEIEHGDVIASWLPLYHDMGLIGCLVLPMLLGLTAVHISPFDWVVQPARLFDMIEQHKASLCWQPNFAFQHLVRTVPKDRRWDLSSMRRFIDCSEPCKPETIAAFQARFAGDGVRPEAMQASYGMAENVFIATQTRPGAPPRMLELDQAALLEQNLALPAQAGRPGLGAVSTGFPIPGTKISILDEAGAPLPERRVGQIAVTSPYLFSGYHGSDLAQTTLKDGWYQSGDYGFIDGGEVFVCGRRDELLIINGRNIYATDVEFAVNQSLPVKPGRCVAVGPYNPRTGSQSLVVIAECEDTAKEVRLQLARDIKTLVLATFGVVPHDVFIADPGWVTKSTSGKISRGANERRYAAERWP